MIDVDRTDRETFGERVRRYRKRHRMTSHDLDRAAGFSLGYTSRIENDRSRPSLNSAKALARALDMTLDQLVGSLESEPPPAVEVAS